MTVTFWTGRGRALIFPVGVIRTNRMSIRFDLGDGEAMTVRKSDIISIEEEQSNP